MYRNLSLTILFAFFVPISLFAQVDGLVAGPMLGRTEMTEVSVWLQTEKPAEVYINYSPLEGDTQNEKKTSAITTSEKDAGVALFKIGYLEPGTTYSYSVVIDGKQSRTTTPLSFTTQSLWQYRTDPPDFKMALGSCAYVNEKKFDRPGKPYGRGYEIFESIHDQRPDAMLWLGDNVYFRETDWNSRSGMLHRYSHTRSLPEMQPLLNSCSHYAIWDDHDFGPNDCNSSFVHKNLSLEAFKLFWGNESFVFPEKGGITQQFQFNDMDFFLMDDRWWRTDHTVENPSPQMLGKEQMDWLILALKKSKAPFKFVAVGVQVLNDDPVYENYSQFKNERAELLKRIDENNIENVIFLTGDRHHTELSKLDMENVTVYDLTCSPLTSRSYGFEKEKNSLSIEESQVSVPNFGILEFSGERKSRLVKMTIYNAAGEELWSRTVDSAHQ